MKLYHGSGTAIAEFKTEFLGIGLEQNGSGFYFTDTYHEAVAYTTHRRESDMVKPGGEDNPSVMVVELAIDDDKFIKGDETIDYDTLEQIIRQGLDRVDDKEAYFDCLVNFGDPSYEGLDTVISRAAASYDGYETILPALFALSNDLFGGEEGNFLRIVSELTGFEGVYAPTDNDDVPNHYIAWLPESITVTEIISIDNEKDNTASPVVKMTY